MINEELEVLNLLKKFNSILTEGFSDSDFGAGSNMSSYYVTIPKGTIKSPTSGVISNYFAIKPGCKNRTVIKFTTNDKTFYFEYCGITDVKVKNGSSVSRGSVLGTSDSDVTATLLNEKGNSYYFKDLNKLSSTTSPTSKTTSSKDPTGLVTYDERLKSSFYGDKSAGDRISGVTIDDRFKNWNY